MQPVLFFFVVAVSRHVAIRANHGNLSQGLRKRQQVAFILEQGHRLAGRLERKRQVFRRPVYPGLQRGIDERMIEEPQLEFDAKNGPDRTIEIDFGRLPSRTQSTSAFWKTS